MRIDRSGSATLPPTALPVARARAVSALALLLCAASFLLPATAHLLGLPVRLLLPMHWPVLLAGLAYGWRGGGLVGVLAPVLSFAMSGMPLPVVLPAMTLELATYGAVAGLLRQGLRWNPLLATAGAIAAGRAVFLATAAATGVAGAAGLAAYLRAALLPGLAAALAQVLLLPLLARWWVRRESRR